MNSAARQMISQTLQVPQASIKVSAIGGGSINQSYRIDAANKLLFCKINSSSKFPQMFLKEVQGLQAIRHVNAIKVPDVVDVLDDGEMQVLLMEYIEEGTRTSPFWASLGEQLAALHRNNAGQCGLDDDNYMGALPQANTWMNDWCSFFIGKRLKPQVELALAAKLITVSESKMFEKLYYKLPELLPGGEFSLLHGDLWSGNFLCDKFNKPVLIDPAVYYGNRYVDIAMTTLFGGFESRFYDAYYYHAGTKPASRIELDIYNLYPLLIHLNLFGRSYLSSILSTLRQF